MVGVQLFQPTAYHLGGLIVPGNAQRLAVGGAGVHQQIHDLIEGIFIIRVRKSSLPLRRRLRWQKRALMFAWSVCPAWMCLTVR